MANLATVVILLACAGYQYLKGTLVKSAVAVINALCAGILAFAWFEPLARLFLTNAQNTRFPALVPWVQPLCFVLLFILAFAVLQAITAQLGKRTVDFGTTVEQVGRVISGIFLGLILSSMLLTALAMAPLPNKYPYRRFEAEDPALENKREVMLNVDGLMPGLFGMVSRGSLRGKIGFAAVHPSFIDQLYLNRHCVSQGVSITSPPDAIRVPEQAAYWQAPDDLRDLDGNIVQAPRGHGGIIARVGITDQGIKGGPFAMSQLRLICKPGGENLGALSKAAANVYPAGYLRTAEQVKITELDDQIELKPADLRDRIRWIDFLFFVPGNCEPSLVEFKQNVVCRLGEPPAAGQAPEIVPFIQPSLCADESAEVQPIPSEPIHGTRLAAGTALLAGIKLQAADPNQWQQSELPESPRPAVFDAGRVVCANSYLKEAAPEEGEGTARRLRSRRSRARDQFDQAKHVRKMLKVPDGYALLSLECSIPPEDTAVAAGSLPALVTLSGLVHHPVGFAAAFGSAEEKIYQINYCAGTTEQFADGIVVKEDGTVLRKFAGNLGLREKAPKLNNLYGLYLVKTGESTFIVSVRSAGSEKSAAFKAFDAFFVK